MLTVNRQKITIGLGILVFGLGVVAFLIMEFSDTFHIPTPDEISAWVEGYGAAGPVVYLLLYAFAPLLFVPSFPISMAAGLLFGPLWGTVFASLGSTLGAILPFIVARHFARPYVARHVRGRLKDLDQKIEDHGWIYLAITRLIPLFPFELLNLEASHAAAWAEIPSGPLVLVPDLRSLPPAGLPLRGPHRLRDSQFRSGSPRGPRQARCARTALQES